MARYLKQAPGGTAKADQQVQATVEEMLAHIEENGTSAIREYSEKLDNWNPESFRVSDEEVAAAGSKVSAELKEHIHFARDQVRRFAEAQLETLDDLRVETLPGVVLGHRHIPVDAVGAYVPGGRYPMLASSFMTIVVPKVAGVPRVVACSAPWEAKGLHPAMLYAMSASGADEIMCVGGVQGLAALALGLDESAPVDMIVGAGNAYVAEAKRQLFGRVGIDLLAGPTEILIIADRTADPELVAADLLGQAEHGPTSPGILVTTSEELGKASLDAVARLLENWPTAEIAGEAWRRNGEVVVVADRSEAVEVADEYAIEHVEVQVDESELDFYLDRLRNYGSLFLGREATVCYGDKAVGTNHVLPTSRAARYTGGLWVGKFLKTVTYQHLTAEGTRRVAPSAAAVAEAEMMLGHAITARMRLEQATQEADVPAV